MLRSVGAQEDLVSLYPNTHSLCALLSHVSELVPPALQLYSALTKVYFLFIYMEPLEPTHLLEALLLSSEYCRIIVYFILIYNYFETKRGRSYSANVVIKFSCFV